MLTDVERKTETGWEWQLEICNVRWNFSLEINSTSGELGYYWCYFSDNKLSQKPEVWWKTTIAQLCIIQHMLQFSCSVMSDSLWPHELQHTRPPCLSPTPRVYPNSCPLSWWRQPTISSSVVPFSSCPQSFPASRYFQMSQLFASGGQSIGVSASTSVLSMNTQDWSPLG